MFDKKYEKSDITELVKAAGHDDYKALKELIKREQQKIYMTFFYLCPDCDDISDMTQETLIKVCRSIKTLKHPEAFGVWLNKTVSNVFYDRMRKRKKLPENISIECSEENSEVLQICDPCKLPDEKTVNKETNEIIKNLIGQLPENFRIVTVLRELRGLSYDEIAKITGTETGTVKSRIARSRNKLRECLQPYLVSD